MKDLAGWLESLGLGQYADLLAREQLTLELVPDLSDDDLRSLGIPLGHRMLFLRAARLLLKEARKSPKAAPPTALPPPEPRNEPIAHDADRRPLTVMFCDLSDSVKITRHLGDEEFRTFLKTYREICEIPVRRYGGFTARYVADGILMYFGYPTAHEDDAERAVMAALEILAGIEDLDARVRDEGCPRIAVHIGIATGTVVVGDLIGGDAAELAAVTGEAPNLAARLQALAKAGTILIDQATRSIAGDLFDYRNLGVHDLKGFETPVDVWHVVGERAYTRFEARKRSGAQFVGRKPQIEALLRQWELARAGQGQIALISGRAGIGKSRLTDAVRTFALKTAARTGTPEPLPIRLQCSRFHSNTPLYPVIRTIERLADIARGETPQARLGKLQSLLDRSQFSAADFALPLFAELLAVPSPQSQAFASLGPREKRLQRLAVLQAWLLSIANAHPVLLAFEDVQWIDPTTRQLLSRLVNALDQSSMLIIATLRTDGERSDDKDDAQSENAADWLMVPNVEIHELDELDDRHSRQLIVEVAGGRPIPEQVVDAIAARALGNPLYIEALTRGWIEASDKGTASPAPTTGAAAELGIPESLSSALMAQIDRLGPSKEVALHAAVIGGEFTTGLLSNITRQRQAALQASLNVLVRSGILKPITSAIEPTFSFKHSLIQDAAYGSLLVSRRKDMHRHVAMVLEEEQANRPDITADLIAQHYAKDHSPGKAIRLWKQAAEQAASKSAYLEAARLLDQALALIPELPDQPERHALELDLTAESAAALRSIRGYAAPVVEARYLKALELCAKSSPPSMRFNVEWGLFQCNLVKGELARADEFAESLMLSASGLPDPLRADAFLASGMARLMQGDYGNARQFFEQAADLTDPNRDSPNLLTHGQNPGIFCRSNLAHTLAIAGFPARARALTESNLEISGNRRSEPAHHYSYINALVFASRVYLFLGEADAVHRTSSELLELARAGHYDYYEATAQALLGWSVAERGAVQIGIDGMLSGIAKLEQTGTRLAARGFYIQLAELYIRSGNRERGLETLEKAVLDTSIGTRGWDAEIERIWGLLSMLEGEAGYAEAERRFLASLTLAQAQGARAIEVRSNVSYARLLCKTNREADAEVRLAASVSQSAMNGEFRDLVEAKSIIRQIEEGKSYGNVDT